VAASPNPPFQRQIEQAGAAVAPFEDLTMTSQIYGDRVSGNCLKVKWTADHLAIPYRWIQTTVMQGDTRSIRQSWRGSRRPWASAADVILGLVPRIHCRRS
jgi:hypothetical protein